MGAGAGELGQSVQRLLPQELGWKSQATPGGRALEHCRGPQCPAPTCQDAGLLPQPLPLEQAGHWPFAALHPVGPWANLGLFHL